MRQKKRVSHLFPLHQVLGFYSHLLGDRKRVTSKMESSGMVLKRHGGNTVGKRRLQTALSGRGDSQPDVSTVYPHTEWH